MTVNFVVPNAAAVTSPASAGVTASDQAAGAPIADASIVTNDDSFPLAAIIGIAVGGGILLLLAGEPSPVLAVATGSSCCGAKAGANSSSLDAS